MPDLFLSYSREDQPTARRFAEGLQRAGFSVWWDQSLKAGEAFDQVTEQQLANAKAVVVLWSKTSVASRWVRAEATQANAAGKLVPVMIEDCKRPIMFELVHTAELQDWKGNTDDPGWLSFTGDLQQFRSAGSVEPASPDRRPALRRSVVAVAAAVLLVTSGASLWWFKGAGWKAIPDNASSTSATRTQVSLAVLPFVNLSSDPEQEYFSDGLTEEMLNQLAQVKDLRVTARTSSFAFKGRNEDLRAIGQKLSVSRILAGSVRKSGQRLAITAQLINARDGTQIWSQTYERELRDVFAIQDEIARAVTGALSVALDVGAMARARGGTTNLEAYDQYLHAAALDRQHRAADAIAYLRETVRLDPAFVSAWAALYYHLAGSLMYQASSEAAENARQEMAQVSTRVLALAPDSWQAQAILAGQLLDQRRWLEAEAAIDKARAAGADFGAHVGAGNSVAHGGVDTLFLWDVGRIGDAIPIVRRRHDADQLSLEVSDSWQLMLLLAHRLPDVEAEYKRTRQFEGDHRATENMEITRQMFNGKGDPASGRTIIERYLHQYNRQIPGARIPQGRIDDKTTLEIFRKVIADPTATSGETIYAALFAGYLGDKQLALAAFRRSYIDQHGPDIFYLWFPFWDSLRAEPEFKRIVRDLGLVDYWRKSNKWSDFCRPTSGDEFECH